MQKAMLIVTATQPVSPMEIQMLPESAKLFSCDVAKHSDSDLAMEMRFLPDLRLVKVSSVGAATKSATRSFFSWR